MQQGIHTRLQLYKGAKISHTCYLTGNDIACSEFLSGIQPWILVREFQAQSNLFTLDILNKDFQFFTNFKYFLRIFYMTPGHLRNMKQTVCSAQINECTEISHILHNTLNHIADCNAFKQRFLQFRFSGYQKLFAVTDNSSSSRIELGNYKLDFLARIFFQIFLIRIRNQAGRNKYTSLINHNAQTAAENLNHRSAQNFLIVKCLFQSLVSSFCCQSLIGQKDLSFSVIYFQNLSFQGVIHMYQIAKIRA